MKGYSADFLRFHFHFYNESICLLYDIKCIHFCAIIVARMIIGYNSSNAFVRCKLENCVFVREDLSRLILITT